MQNLPIYLCCLAFAVLTVRALLRRNLPQNAPYLNYLLLLLPGLLLPLLAAMIGVRYMPRHEIVIHGYRVPLPESNKIYLGADTRDDLTLHHRLKDSEMLEKSLLEIEFLGASKQKTITQTVTNTPNVVSVGGLPIRSLKLSPGKTHQISFKAFNFSQEPADCLLLTIPSHSHIIGDFAFSHPVFSFRGREYDAGFSQDVGWIFASFLPNVAISSNVPRHLAWQNRIFHRRLASPTGSLLKQAALIRRGDDYYLAANDAEIRLDGQDFPNSITTAGASQLKVESLQFGGNRFATQFKIIPPTRATKQVFLELLTKHKRQLPAISVADRICLTRKATAFSQTFDVLNDHFPTRGMILSREDHHFIFRGKPLELSTPYSCGKVVFTLEQVSLNTALIPAYFALAFLLSALFLPATLLRQVPLLGPVIAAGVFLHGLRQLIAFRAWQGPPYNFNVFLDSAAAPFIFILAVVVLLSREPFYDLFRNGLVRLRNFVIPHRSRATTAPRDGNGGKATLALLLYGAVLSLSFHRWLGLNFIFILVFFALLSVLLAQLARWERSLGARPLLSSSMARYLPMLSLLVLFIFAAISAPLLGGREIIPFLPGRPRPDILIQVILLVIVAYQAGLWERERRSKVANLLAILVVYVAIFLLPFIQGVLAHDMGFFLVVACPLLTILLLASWSLDRRLKALFALTLVLLIATPLYFKYRQIPLDSVTAQRVAFWIDKPRLRSEHFFDYQAQIPILWSSNQGRSGGGYFSGDWYPALRGTAVNDNVASVFIQGELGGIGSILVMLVYALLASGGLLFVRDNRHRVGGFRVWIILGVALTFVWTATAMFLQNLGYMPLTGKNLPFLGLDSLNDTIRYSLLLGLMVRYMRELEE